jgi:phosphoglucan,water dikinase
MEDNKQPKFIFNIVCKETKLGENVYLTGNSNELGNWDPHKSIQMKTDSKLFPQWESDPIKLNTKKLEYKYFIKSGNNCRWESFQGNREISLVDLQLNNLSIYIKDAQFNTKGTAQIGGSANEVKQTYKNGTVNNHINSTPLTTQEVIALFHSDDDKINKFIDIERNAKTWKEKLEALLSIMSEYRDSQTLSMAACYLHFLSSGQIKCDENGTHFRPNHHAEMAYKIFKLLLTTQNDDNVLIVRNILKNLPSFSDQYLVSVPLTRIRDIAHRNDIPSDLKNEIKHKLQNKLHRSASPDDLKTCEYFIEKINNGHYSTEFVKEFYIFYDELKEFFNALGLEKNLVKLKDVLSKSQKHVGNIKANIDKFLDAKRNNNLLYKLEAISELRGEIMEYLKDEIFEQINSDTINKTLLQIITVSELELEHYYFVAVSEYLSKYDKQNSIKDHDFQEIIKITLQCLDNLIYSNINREECSYINDDLTYFSMLLKNDLSNKSNLLKVKACCERSLHLCYSITENIERDFMSSALKLGEALKIDSYAVRVFSEGVIRSHTVFQLSKILSLLLQYFRDKLHLPPYTVINVGKCNGFYLLLKSLDSFYQNQINKNKNYILFLEEADGTEELPSQIKAVILGHDLPQLSHLAIRARQNKCVFVSCLDDVTFAKQASRFRSDDYLEFDLTNEPKDNLHIDIKTFNNSVAFEKKNSSEDIDFGSSEVEELKLPNLVQISDVEKQFSGLKAYNMKLLTNLAKDSKDDSLFKTPLSCAIPYNSYSTVMESTLISEDITKIDESDLKDLESASKKFINDLVNKLESSNHPILEDICDKIATVFNGKRKIAIRSSSNLEDLKKNAGAGLFDSELGIDPEKPEEVRKAVIKVWASIFNYRALISRRKSKISSCLAKMGILVQEMVSPNFAFIIHTTNPITKNENEVYIEIAIGLGETLASANQKGSPYRLTFNDKDEANIFNYASFSYSLCEGQNGLMKKLIKYKDEPLSNDDSVITNTCRKLGLIGRYIEENVDVMKTAQDIEGAYQDGEFYVLQTRPQIL